MTHTSATLIDHVIDNLDNETEACGVITTQLHGSSGYTDHFPIYSLVKTNIARTKGPATITRRNINAHTRRTFSQQLS